MNMKELAKKVAKIEGGKQSLSIAQITEVLRILSEFIAEDDQDFEDGFENHPTYKALLRNGKRRMRMK